VLKRFHGAGVEWNGDGGVALIGRSAISPQVKVVKQQINGGERVVLKENATADDLKSEAQRLKKNLGYDIQADKRRGTFIASHSFFRGKFVLSLEAD
jgi:hypothetical protein